jgi:hypothetical protein
MRIARKQILTTIRGARCALASVATAQGYAFNVIGPDVRQPSSVSGGSACPVKAHHPTTPGYLVFRWTTSLGTAPTTILTQDQTPTGRLNEIEEIIQQSLGVWTNVTALSPSWVSPLARVAAQNACGSDGINSLCFDQPDLGFTPGVLAFTRVIVADRIGIQVGAGPVATELGQILDADIYFNPNDIFVTFATPQVLAANPKSYDFESLQTHELGHALGFSHSNVWSAMMFPFAPTPGTFAGARPTAQQPDAPLSDDHRTGLRVLYHDPNDSTYIGSVQGGIVPANPLSLPAAPPGVTGIFLAHVVAIDSSSGAVVAGSLGGWSCQAPGPSQFDGSYEIDGLAVGRSYNLYVEPLNGAAGPATVTNAFLPLSRNSTTDPGWPPLQACIVPAPDLEFTARTLP